MDINSGCSTISLFDHDKASIQAFLGKDIEDAQKLDFDIFIDAVFGLSPKTMKEQSLKIRELNWLEDPDIQMSLEDFCYVEEEADRYQPLAVLTNRIIELARGSLPGIPDAYPIDDICLVRNDPIAIQTIPEHGLIGSIRKPDLVMVRAIHANLPEHPAGSRAAVPGIKWSNIMASWELKGYKNLTSRLVALLEDRRLKSPRFGGEAVPLVPLSERRKRASEDQPEKTTRIRQRYLPQRNTTSTDTHAVAYPGPPKISKLQAGSYALETLACTYGTRLFCVNVVMDEDRIHLWYYDACGAVRTKDTISLIDDFEKAAALIVGIATSSPERLGALPSCISPPPSAPYPASWPPENLQDHTLTLHRPPEKDLSITLAQPVFAQYGLSGRRTFVYNIQPNRAISNEEMIVKMSYQVDTRKPEQDLVMIARKAGVEHLPRIHLAGALFKMSDGVRRIFLERGGITYEDRTLRVIIYSKYLPLSSLVPQHPECLREMTVQIINCLYDLKEKANILHRDISVNNIMYELREGDPYFVLIDYDMAVILPPPGEHRTPQSNYHEGTLPFMAVDLLRNAAYPHRTPVPHSLRHDYESVFWVAVWCEAVFAEPTNEKEEVQKETNVAIVRAWETCEFAAIAHAKVNIRRYPLDDHDFQLIGKSDCLWEWFKGWTELWMDVDAAFIHARHAAVTAARYGLPAPAFDSETIDGTFTRDTILAALGVPPVTTIATRKAENATKNETPAARAEGKQTAVRKVTTAASKKKTRTTATKAAVTRPLAVNAIIDEDLAHEDPEIVYHNARHGYALRTRKPPATAAPKVSSRKVGTVTRKTTPEGSTARKKKPSTPVKEAAVKAAAKRTTVKKAATRKKGTTETGAKKAMAKKTVVTEAVATTEAAATMKKAATKKAKATKMKR